MPDYILAGIKIHIEDPITILEPYRSQENHKDRSEQVLPSIQTKPGVDSYRHSLGWVGGADRLVAAEDVSDGMILRIESESACLIGSSGRSISNLSSSPADSPSQLDQDLISGPALVQALALQSIWCLHASAAVCKGSTFAFLGESGQGKSTLAAYLSHQDDWQLIADDILPVTCTPSSVLAWPRFPQLKLPNDAQPGLNLPDSIKVDHLILLETPEEINKPAIYQLGQAESVKVLLSNTAGSRLYAPEILAEHLAFCTRAAPLLDVHRLAFPHNIELLPSIHSLLEDLC